MNILHERFGFQRVTQEIIKFGSVLLLGMSIGTLSTSYSPLFTVIGTVIFAILSIVLYTRSYARREPIIEDGSSLTDVIEERSGLLFYLFYFSLKIF